MRCRIRHGVECPKCLTRYLVAFSPYGNGSYLAPTVAGSLGECILFCSCATPHIKSRWRWVDVRTYVVSKSADRRGYGTPAEVVTAGNRLRAVRHA